MIHKTKYALLAALAVWGFGFLMPAQAAQHALGSNVVTPEGTVYTITVENGQTVRRPYTSPGAFLSYSFNAWGTIVMVSAEDTALPIGSFVPPRDGKIICSDRGSDKGTCYLVSAGKKAGFTSAEIFLGLGYSFSNTTSGDVSFLPSMMNIDSGSMPHNAGSLVNNSGTVYLVDSNGLVGIPNWQTLASWGYDFTDVVPANAADISLPASASTLEPRPAESLQILESNTGTIVPQAIALTNTPVPVQPQPQQTSATSSPPTIISIDSTSGPVGTQVTISGTGFTPAGNDVATYYKEGTSTVYYAMAKGVSSPDGKTLIFTIPSQTVFNCEPPCMWWFCTFPSGTVYPIIVHNVNGDSNYQMLTITNASTLEYQPVTVQDLVSDPVRYLNKKVEVSGKLVYHGNYYIDPNFYVTDSIMEFWVNMWAPLEAISSPNGGSSQPATMQTFVDKNVTLKGTVEMSVGNYQLKVSSAVIK